MRSITDTIQRLAAHRGRPRPSPVPHSTRLSELRDFGSNPGALRAFSFVPSQRAAAPALVVVLHGCTQEAAGFDHGSGWSDLAQQHGFAVLFPEQTRANNFNLCFNWYEPADSGRSGGEPVSISQMIETMVVRHGIDRARIFITGLSAGGAMTAVMLATHPEVFAGGAIVAGLPYRCAASVPEAFDRMRGHKLADAAGSTRAVRDASSHQGPWPSVSVWHGARDSTVDVSNAGAAIEQWRGIHGAAAVATETVVGEGFRHRIWRDDANRVVIEEYLVDGMGHGLPLSGSGADACGSPGPYMLDVGISSTRRMAESWGLMTDAAQRQVPAVVRHAPHTEARMEDDRPMEDNRPMEVGQVIETALRAAGLMR